MTAPTVTVVHRVAVITAGIAAAFVLTIAGVLLWLHLGATTNDPWKSPQLLELKEQLRAAPKDEAVKARIRELDFQFRQRYVQRLRLGQTGGWLLVAGTVILVVALQTSVEARQRLPQPRPDPQAAANAARRAAQSRRAVAITGAVCAGGMLAVAWGVRSHFATLAKIVAPGSPAAAAATTPLPPPEEFARNWPRFRGPDGGGTAAGEAPLHWDAATGAGVAWKTAVPAPGFNSPIVWGNRVFVSGATREARTVFCYDTASGALVWQCAIPLPTGPGVQALEISEETGYAASTLATDGRHVYAIFGHGDLTAITLAGKVAWTKHLGVPKNPFGHATSLAVWQGRVIVQFDQGEVDARKSRLFAYDGANGKLLWEKPRSISTSWATPIVVEAAGRTQIITLGVPQVIAYAFADGAELWSARVMDGEVTPSPVFAGGLVLVIKPEHALIAIKPDGTGDVTETHVAWKTEESMPDVTSPVSDGTWAFAVNGSGELLCFETKQGAKVWTKELDANVQASPAIFGRRMYVTLADGVTVVAEVGAEYRELARNPLGEQVFASPAFAGGRLYLRGHKHLFCLTGTATPAATAKP
jgi:outer membrane protein assembly factor BamB